MFIKIVKEYERRHFRLGKVLEGAKGPGLFILVPFVDKMVKVDMRTITRCAIAGSDYAGQRHCTRQRRDLFPRA